MCGIVGYVGMREAYPILIKGLHRLEYRGYDSAGVALINAEGKLNVYKAKGKVSDLETVAKDKDCAGTVGIAHTRWATHGEPSVRNAHPHVSQSGNLVIVHNGIIENFAVLRKQLAKKGFTFQSDTDTEVLVQLIEYAEQQHKKGLVNAVRHALRKVIGAYAIAVIDRNNPNQIVAARKGSPLVIGVGEKNSEFFIGSDASPIAEYTKNVVYPDDQQIVVCELGKELQIINLENEPIDVAIHKIDMDLSMLSKGGFRHYMLKEIFDQPSCLSDCMSGRLVKNTNNQWDIVLSCITNFKKKLINTPR